MVHARLYVEPPESLLLVYTTQNLDIKPALAFTEGLCEYATLPESYEFASRVRIIVVLQPHHGQILCQYGDVFLRKKYFSTMRIDRQRGHKPRLCH